MTASKIPEFEALASMPVRTFLDRIFLEEQFARTSSFCVSASGILIRWEFRDVRNAIAAIALKRDEMHQKIEDPIDLPAEFLHTT